MSDQLIRQTKQVHQISVTIDRALCIGAATCTAIAPHAFSLDGEGKVLFGERPDQDSAESIIQAAQACPVFAIVVQNEKGQQIVPK